MLENRKFIAFLDEKTELGSGSALFYITDVNSWNENNKPSNETYNDSVYNAIEKLSKNCRQIGANHFEVFRPIETTLELKSFLKSIPWIKVIDEDEAYINPNDITSMRDNEKDSISVIKRISGRFPKKVVVDETIYCERGEKNSQLEVEFAFVEYARQNDLPQIQVYQDVTSEKKHVGEIKEFTDKYVQDGKIIYCLAINNDKIALFAFDNQKQIDEVKKSKAYQKYLSGEDFEEDFEEVKFEDYDLV